MKRCQISISNLEYPALLTENYQEQLKGLMHINPPTPIMIFNYDSPKINKFWMKNTPAPLDIVFCNHNTVIDICYGEPYSTKLIGGDYESNLIVELPYGTCKKNNINLGDSCKIININEDSFNFSQIFSRHYY